MINIDSADETVPNACSHQRCFYPGDNTHLLMVSMLANGLWRSTHPDLWHLVELPYDVPASAFNVAMDKVLIDPATHAFLQFKPPKSLTEENGFITHIVVATEANAFTPLVPGWLFGD